ncbi:dihydrolipoyl dehydrogenase [Oceanirhabdus seepicola]|uniref:Dihydrolipoyl dehydrogenase n=1 Tax=Oceanirhabdus seepicola TaxID=2828781 RepID=A0A9J6P1S8_9CLOT|nr:dihydrolipoyl dehydrogenase [Oceanirhabdus seepicola]MCM1989456.1 dihydrolipoyl dehydrogenase [Oceanirhabdus seepicola]
MKRYDVVILGSGPAGLEVSNMLSHTDKSICIIEKFEENFGGTCVNQGCMPTKALVKSAEIVEMANKAEMFGVEIPNVNPNMKKISGILNKTTEMLSGFHMSSQKSEIIFGHGRFVDANHIEVSKSDGSNEVIFGNEIVIATGSRARLLPNIHVDGKYVCTSDELLKNDEIPKSLLVIGGGVIGCEFASIYSRLGTEVMMVEMSDYIMPAEDIDTSVMVKEIFSNREIEVHTSTCVKKVEIVDNKVNCYFDGAINEERIFDKVLLSIGRVPNIDELNLEKAGVETENGFIKVNEYLQSTKDNIYGVGDVVPTLMLAHTAVYESMIVSSNIMNEKSKKYENFTAPRVVYTSPEIASVGLTERQAKGEEEIKVINFPMRMNGKAILEKATEGRLKLILDKKTEVILGANIIGKNATELIHELALAVRHKLTLSDLRETVHAHPTLAEIIWFATFKG